MDGLLQEPPLVLPEGCSNSLESQDNSEISERVDAVSEKTGHILSDSEFMPPPPPSTSFPDTEFDETEGMTTSNSEAAFTPASYSVPVDSGPHPETEADNVTGMHTTDVASTSEQVNTEFCVVEDTTLPSGTRESSLERISGEDICRDSTTSPEVDHGFIENGHISEESFSSYQLVKSEGDQTPVFASEMLPSELVDSHEQHQQQDDVADFIEDRSLKGNLEQDSTSEPMNNTEPVKQTIETIDLQTKNDDFYPETSVDYIPYNEPKSTGITEQSAELLSYSASCAPYDASMSTTGGISEIVSERITQEPLNQDSLNTEELGCVTQDIETDNRTSYDVESSYHDEVAAEDVDEMTEKGSGIQVCPNVQPEVADFDLIEEESRPSFKAICEELEKKNVVSHLKQCHSGPFVMNPPIAGLRQQDIVVLNPKTGEVLGANQHAVQPIHAAQIDILKATNEQTTNGGIDQHLNGSDDLVQQSGYHMQQNGNSSSVSRGGGGGGASDEGSGNTNDGGHPIHSGAMERARQVYNMAQCQMAHVTVYLDRALICRRIRPRFKASEITEVVFEHLSPAIDKDSVRVEIRGAATILDVTYTARSLSEEEDTWTHTINELVNELRQCQRQQECLSGRIVRTNKQRLVLDTFADNLIRRDEETISTSPPSGGSAAHPTVLPPPANSATGAPSPALSGDHKSSSEVINPYDPRHMDTLHRFLGIYEEQAERLDASLLDATEELDHVQARIEAIEKELREIELKQDQRLARELSVLVEPRETGQVEMLISYVVARCSWKPAYDIRIFNSDGTMKIVYYGMIQQATGEDWETRSMTLSTTTPGTGGTVPHLGLQRVHFKKDHSPSLAVRQMNSNHMSQLPPLVVPNANRTRSQTKIGGFRRPARPTTTSFHEAERILNDMERETPTPGCTLQRGSSLEVPASGEPRISASRTPSRRALGASMLFHAPSSSGQSVLLVQNVNSTAPSLTSTVTGGVGSGTSNVATVHLDVPRPPSLVRCDNAPVRVTVGLLDLQPRYEYVTVPKRALYAYLKATAVNRSDFLILAGQTNIYADNTFIGKSELPAVAQGEEFSCNLGSEQGIKVFYRPLFKYREGTGSGGKHTTLTFKQLIEVRNSFDRPIRLTVVDQVPVSGEDKIKITLLEPVIKHPEKYDRNKPIRMNKSNNVEWDLDLGPGETKELTLKYSIEHPATEDLDVSVSEV